MRRLAILGASGHGRVVADTAELCGWQVAFFDDAHPAASRNAHWPVLGDWDNLLSRLSDFEGVVVAIGNNRTRLAKLEALRARGVGLPSLIHPAAVVSRHAWLGDGGVVFAGVVVNACADIGAGVILNTQCSIDHDCVLEAGVHVSPGAHLAGGVRVGEASWVGIGASIRQMTVIGRGVIVGAGAAVVADVPDNVTVVGVPARTI